MPSKKNSIPGWLFNFGYIVAIIVAVFCLAFCCVYLLKFLSQSSQSVAMLIEITSEGAPISDSVIRLSIAAQTQLGRLTLLSCGVAVGMAFGFIGFALFLLGIKGEIEVEGASEQYSIKIFRLAPGAFVILCSIILIGICVSRKTPFEYSDFSESPSLKTERLPSILERDIRPPDRNEEP